MKIDDLLDRLDDMVDKAWSFPLSGGRCVLDADKVRNIIDDLRLNLPKEIPQAKAIVADRMQIIKDAKEEAQNILKDAERKARIMVSENEIVTGAQKKADMILKDSVEKSKNMKIGAADFSDSILKQAEDDVASMLMEIRKARKTLKSPSKI